MNDQVPMTKPQGIPNAQFGVWALLSIWILVIGVFPSEAAEKHWAFQPVVKPKLPVVKHSPWVRNPIDRFVLARLEVEGVRPAARAGKGTLLRRLSLDFVGVPPSPAELAAYERDDSPEAYAKVVQRLLASPHYGERMAQGWLDLARFADTSGYAADRTRNVWPYRDWVIAAFNANMPYDRFSIEQLAGDLLPNATPEQRLATGFHRQAMQAKGNNPRKEEFRIKGIVDRLQTTGRTWLGLTLECAECHDHKHDPISQKEYYRLFAIFNNVPHLGSGYNVHGPRMAYTVADPRRAVLEQRLAALRPKLGALGAKQPGVLGEWAGPAREQEAAKFSVRGSFTVTAEIETKAPIGNIISKYDWKAGQRSFVVGVGGEGDAKAAPGHLFAWISSEAGAFRGVVAYGSRPVNDGRRHHVAVVFEAGKAIRFFVDGVEDRNVRLEGAPPASIAQSMRPLAIGAGYNNAAEPNAFRFQGKLERVRLYDRALANPLGLDLTQPAAKEFAKVSAELGTLKVRRLEVPVMAELPQPRATHVHVRGEFNQKGEAVQPGLPAFLPGWPMRERRPMNRLDFARWLFASGHPLTARVEVNRIWQHHFGEGLVRTPADFGRHGAAPTHPHLLDWLAATFVESGWDRKALHRLIVESATYQQSSAMRDGKGVNLLARFPRQRLQAEQIRDSALAVAGLLDPRVGGASVFPDQPAGLYEERGQNTPGNSNFTWKNSEGPDRFRRSLYTYWKRMMLHPALAAFDAPPRQVCVAKRTVTNTPQQALVALNEPIFAEAAAALAQRLERDGHKDDAAKITAVFRLCFAREPDAVERRMCEMFLADHRARGEDGAWTALASVLMNLDEWLVRE